MDVEREHRKGKIGKGTSVREHRKGNIGKIGRKNRVQKKLDDSTEIVFQTSIGKDLMYSGSLNFACLIYY